MKTRSWALTALTCACVLAPATSALAAPTVSQLRVEAEGRALDPGYSYVNDTARLRSDSSRACGGSGRTTTVRGPSAIGLVQYGRAFNRDLRPYRVSDKFDFGLIVCGIGPSVAFSANQFWGLRVNHAESQVGGDQVKLRRGDEVLWYFVDFDKNQNTGGELVLDAPLRARPGEPFTVTSSVYDAAGRRTPAPGVRVDVRGTSNDPVTDGDGRAQITAERSGSLRLRARRGGDIKAEERGVCINRVASRCVAREGEFIVGTSGADRITGTAGSDQVRGQGGADRIDVRGGSVDEVRCGSGRDRVLADRADTVTRDCNRVERRGSGG